MPASNENDLSYSRAVRMAGLIHTIREKQPLTVEEQQELDDWLHDNEANRKMFESLQDRALLTGELEVLMQYNEEKGVSAIFRTLKERPPSTVKKMQLMTRWLSVAASVLLLASAAWWFFTRQGVTEQDGKPSMAAVTMLPGDNKALLTLADGSQVMLDGVHTRSLGMQGGTRVEQQQERLVYTAGNNGPVLYNTVTTPRGGQYRLGLPDGSEVWLNAATSITYPTSFSGDMREVTITGEAYFSVAKDKTKPFFVTADAMKVQVVGTEFNVMAYTDEDAIRTTLVEGVVKAVSTNQKAPAQELTLKPGEQAALIHGPELLRMEKVNPDEVTGWRLGRFNFHETNMAAIMRQVARWYDVKVEYRGAAASINFNGQISRTKRVEELLNILSDTRDVHFEIKDDKTIVVIPGHK
jgi:transmembrane sensor